MQTSARTHDSTHLISLANCDRLESLDQKCKNHVILFCQALQYHEIDLRLSQDQGKVMGKARAYGNIGLVHESMGNYEDALLYQEHHLNAATQMDDAVAKSIAFSSIGKSKVEIIQCAFLLECS